MEPTEAEIEAAALANKQFETGVKDARLGTPESLWGKYERERARAVLTAAARVREEGRSPYDYIVNCAKPDCDGVHGVESLADAPHGVRARDCSCHMAIFAEPVSLGEKE